MATAGGKCTLQQTEQEAFSLSSLDLGVLTQYSADQDGSGNGGNSSSSSGSSGEEEEDDDHDG
jgi:hypothetical protein